MIRDQLAGLYHEIIAVEKVGTEQRKFDQDRVSLMQYHVHNEPFKIIVCNLIYSYLLTKVYPVVLTFIILAVANRLNNTYFDFIRLAVACSSTFFFVSFYFKRKLLINNYSKASKHLIMVRLFSNHKHLVML